MDNYLSLGHDINLLWACGYLIYKRKKGSDCIRGFWMVLGRPCGISWKPRAITVEANREANHQVSAPSPHLQTKKFSFHHFYMLRSCLGFHLKGLSFKKNLKITVDKLPPDNVTPKTPQLSSPRPHKISL